MEEQGGEQTRRAHLSRAQFTVAGETRFQSADAAGMRNCVFSVLITAVLTEVVSVG